MPTISLPYGDGTRALVTTAQVTTIRAPSLPSPPPLAPLLADAIAAAPPPARSSDRVLLILSDATRDEPRAAFLAALLPHLPSSVTLAYATGTHGPVTAPLVSTSLPVINHDGTGTVDAGTTSRGTPVRVHRAVIESDLVIATGVIRPHYFAGFGAGAKAIFPGLAEPAAARINHLLKQHPSARPGNVLTNECRLDLEEAALLAAPRSFLLNGVADADNQIRAAVAGDLVHAFRHGCSLAAPWVRASAPRHQHILVADHAPTTDSLYQASKLVASVAHLLLPGGTIFVLAPCRDGIGPVDTVNRAIYDIGLKPRLPADHRIVLVSDLPDSEVAPSYATPGQLDQLSSLPSLLVVPAASKLIIDALD